MTDFRTAGVESVTGLAPAVMLLVLAAASFGGIALGSSLVGLGLGALALVLAALRLGVPAGQLVVLAFVAASGLNLADVLAARAGATWPVKLLVATMLSFIAVDALRARRVPALYGSGVAAVALFCAAGGVGVISAHHTDMAFAGFDELIRNVTVALLLGASLTERSSLHRASLTLMGALTVLAAIGSMQALTGSYESDFYGFARAVEQHIAGTIDSYRISGPFSDPNSFGRVLLIAVPLTIIEFVHAGRLLPRVLTGAAFAVLLTAILFTYSRGALAGLLVILVLAAARLRAARLPLLAMAALGTMLVVMLAPAMLLDRMWAAADLLSGTQVTSRGDDQSIANRLDEMLLAARMFLDHPVAGVGIANYPLLFQQYALDASAIFRHEDREAHSWFLELAAEQGLIGLATFVAMLWSIARGLASAAWSRADLPRRDADLAYGLGLALAGYLSASIFLHQDYPRFFWLLIGMAIAVPVAMRSKAHVG